jgi:hypothetical protein
MADLECAVQPGGCPVESGSGFLFNGGESRRFAFLALMWRTVSAPGEN